MTQEHPIIPPPELVEQWYETADNSSKDVIQEVATQAACWGAQQKLKTCVEWMTENFHPLTVEQFRTDCR